MEGIRKARPRAVMLLERSAAEALLDYLDHELPKQGCDHSLRLTNAWAVRAGVAAPALAMSLEQFGGLRDCEVLANVDPETIY